MGKLAPFPILVIVILLVLVRLTLTYVTGFSEETHDTSTNAHRHFGFVVHRDLHVVDGECLTHKTCHLTTPLGAGFGVRLSGDDCGGPS